MNLANQITILRMLLVPVFLFFLINIKEEWAFYVCVVIFIIAALTDGVDGYIARKYNMITTFGKFVDPLADKILVTAALTGLVELGSISSWVAVIIITREFIVTSLRVVAISDGKVIAASYWGKVKTVAQIVMIVTMLVDKIWVMNVFFTQTVIYAAVFLTLYSGIDYFLKNKDVLDSM